MYSARYIRTFGSGAGVIGRLYSLSAPERDGYGDISRLPVSLRVLLESLLHHADSRRGNHQVMMRGCLANSQLVNLMLPQGGITLHQPDAQRSFIYDIAMRYRTERVPLVVFAGHNYGTGSRRDRAAKGVTLLGVRAVIASSFERIHGGNLVDMGVLPLGFLSQDSVASLKLHGRKRFDLSFIEYGLHPGMLLTFQIYYPNGQQRSCTLRLRIDTEAEATYYRHGGLMPYLVRTLLNNTSHSTQQVPA